MVLHAPLVGGFCFVAGASEMQSDPIAITFVAGTHDWMPFERRRDRWWQSQSDHTRQMEKLGCVRIGWEYHGMEVPPWAAALGGTFFSGSALRGWARGALGLAEDLERRPREDRNLECHSHAGSLGVMVAWLLKDVGGLNRLITVCSPRRRGRIRTPDVALPTMEEMYACVSCPWLAIYGTNVVTNAMQWLGARGNSWRMPAPAQNVRLKGIGHSAFLRDSRRFASTHHDLVMPFLRTGSVPSRFRDE